MDQEKEDALIQFKNRVVEIVKDISYIAETTQDRSNTILNKINNIRHSDTKDLEAVGINIVRLLKAVKGNMIVFSNMLEDELKKVSGGKLFMELRTELLESKTNGFIKGPNNECISTVPSEKAVQTDDEIKTGNNMQLTTEGKMDVNEDKERTKCPDELINEVSTVKLNLKRGILSLKQTERTDTQDTDDCWTDTLNRSATALDLWNGEYQGTKSSGMGEDAIQSEEQEEDQWDKKTVQLNNAEDENGSDDTFVDGRVPDKIEEESVKEEDQGVNMEAKEISEQNCKSPTAEEKSFVIEENKVSEVDTAPKSTDANTGKNSDTDNSNFENIDNPETIGTKSGSPINPDPGIDYENPIPSCSKNEIYYVSCSKTLKNLEKQEGSVDSESADMENSNGATENPAEIEYSQSAEETGSGDEQMPSILPNDTYISPYSVETVKLRSDSDDWISSQYSDNSDNGEFNGLTQIVSNESNSKPQEHKSDTNINTAEDASNLSSKLKTNEEKCKVAEYLLETDIESDNKLQTPHFSEKSIICKNVMNNNPITEHLVCPDFTKPASESDKKVNLETNISKSEENIVTDTCTVTCTNPTELELSNNKKTEIRDINKRHSDIPEEYDFVSEENKHLAENKNIDPMERKATEIPKESDLSSNNDLADKDINKQPLNEDDVGSKNKSTDINKKSSTTSNSKGDETDIEDNEQNNIGSLIVSSKDENPIFHKDLTVADDDDNDDFLVSQEKDVKSNKTHSDSDQMDIDDSSKPELKQNIIEQSTQRENSIKRDINCEETVSQTLDISAQVDIEEVDKDYKKNNSESDSSETIICGHDELDKLSDDDKTDIEVDENQSRQMIDFDMKVDSSSHTEQNVAETDFVESRSHSPINIVVPQKETDTAEINVDMQTDTDILPHDDKSLNNTNVETTKNVTDTEHSELTDLKKKFLEVHDSSKELSNKLISDSDNNKVEKLSNDYHFETEHSNSGNNCISPELFPTTEELGPPIGKNRINIGDDKSKQDQITEWGVEDTPLDSPQKARSDEDDTCSNKSYEFDISECLNQIGETLSTNNLKEKSALSEDMLPDLNKGCQEIGDITSEIDDKETPTDIIEALEELLSSGDQNKDKQQNNTSDDKQDRSKEKDAGVKETIEILSDSEDDEIHLDVTMEEIISTGSSITIECISDEEDNTKKEIQKDDTLKNSNHLEQNQMLTQNNDNKGDGLADELLELLREVQVSTDLNETSGRKSKGKSDKKEIREADEIFKMLQEESPSDMSDIELSDDDPDLSLSDIEWLEDIDNKKKIAEDEEKSSETKNEQHVQIHNISDCYVKLERLDIRENEVVKINKKLGDSIDRLCDISNLLNKRKFVYTLSQNEKLRSKKMKRSKQGASDVDTEYDSYSDFTDTESDKDLPRSPILSAPLEQKLDDMLANEICKDFKGNTSDDTSDYDSDESGNSTKKKKQKNKHEDNKHSDSDKKQKLSKEEQEKKSWKNDPLLRGKLDSDSESNTSSSENYRKQKNILKSRYERDTDFYIASDSTDSDSDASTKRKQDKVLMSKNTITPTKKNIAITDSDTTDSDIEFVPQQKSPEKNTGDDTALNSSQKGRRNIRALMSAESLAEATQRANKEEQERIERLEDRYRIKESLSQSVSQNDIELEEDSLVLDVDVTTGEPIIKVHPGLNKKLKPHQREGIQFMWDSCYESIDRLKIDEGSGCILAHCMGLGKTFQVLALIHALFANEITNTKHVLVVCPLSTVNNWKKEVKIIFKDLPEEKLNVLTIADKKETAKKYEIVKKWHLKRKCVLVLGYEGFETLTNEDKLDKGGKYLRDRMLEALVDPGPDLVICDEGHLLRNKKALKTMALNRIRTKRRIVLTGTPLQNNLLEYYHMVQFVKPNLLGNMKEFKTNFVNPIINGQYEDSTKDDIKLMMKRTHVLHKLLKKSIQRVEDTELKGYLPKMLDYAVFVQLHEVQVELYNKFSELVQKNSTNTNRRGFLSDFAVFQYIGTHPHLLSVIDKMKNKKIKERDLITNEQEDNPICNIDGWWKAKIPEDAEEKIDYGNKLMVVKSILEECEEIGDKVLIFSQSLGELDLIEYFLTNVGTTNCPSWKKAVDYFRMDGTVNPEYRSVICDCFNDPDKKQIRLLLMSTKVGGLGLNLTAANRVIIMTVNWNPSFDTQSVFRVYRFGQEKEVYVYRLISLDTMEEKVYQRTVTKLAIAHRVVDKHQITRHYKSMDLQELYSCRPTTGGERPTPNVPEDQVLAKLILNLPFIYKYHEHQALLANRPEDNLNEQELNAAWDEFKKIKDATKIPPGAVPQNIPNFNLAYALTRPNQPSGGSQNTNKPGVSSEMEINKDWLLQFMPKPSSSILQQKNGSPDNSKSHVKGNLKKNPTGTNVNMLHRRPNLPNTVITLEDNPNSGMIPLTATTSSTSVMEQDPLYIPEVPKLGTNYSSVLTHLAEKQKMPKLPPLENKLPEKSNQKENIHNIKNKLSKTVPNNSIVIDDDDERNISKLPKIGLLANVSNNKPLLPETSYVNKAKRKLDDALYGQDSIIKKMKSQFNKLTNSQISINLDDDDDDVTEITDTTSDSSSLSNDIVKNLSLSGITIHKVMKDLNTNNNIITLD